MLYFKHHFVFLFNFVQFLSNENMTQKAIAELLCISEQHSGV